MRSKSFLIKEAATAARSTIMTSSHCRRSLFSGCVGTLFNPDTLADLESAGVLTWVKLL